MRKRLLRSIEMEPLQAAAYEMLCWVEAFAEQPQPSNINRVIAQLTEIPDKKRTLIGLASLMLRIGKPQEAVTMLDHLNSLRLAPNDAQAVSVLQERLAADHPEVAATSAGSRREVAVEIAPGGSELKSQSVALPDDL